MIDRVSDMPAVDGWEPRHFLRILVRRHPEEPDTEGMLSPYAGQWQFRMDMMIGPVQHNFTWLQTSQEEEPPPRPWMIQQGLRFMADKMAPHD